MRLLLPIACLSLAACGKGEERQPPPAPTPRATAPAPRTPVMQVTPAPGDEPAWMTPSNPPGAPATAPYGNLLDQPVAKGTSAR